MVINSAVYNMREHADTETKQPFINIMRQFTQKVVIGKTSCHQLASLEVDGRIASIFGGDGGGDDPGEAIRGAQAARLSGEASRR
ncbi:hypothetical protein [Agrobacterium larrymoorei]|uniref:Uncharacterized protein n=1 Tax=Agrobacterium larrymoorei TaxID=160699 RepID=A0A4D7DY24_9HYPH|nr:hypothetical protein [Agrobacterium larrymoorei]QCJ00388.1 hypothetical protein CFBP5473_20975 [Agrobacterium larrymoorei]QYA09166.1 hypothetical protein J5285_17385 [Agrobacterium larrymoorei]WHA43453.1 hypothetical protein CFBP5477_019675 [Agrobacterium larrymoorei]